MLSRDRDHFERAYPAAHAFITAANLRREAFALCRMSLRTPWQENRLAELLESAPACREPWFASLYEEGDES